MNDDLGRQILDHLDVAGARVGSPAHLTTAELVDRVDAERPAVEEALTRLRFEEGRVLKGPDVGEDGSEWRVADDDPDDYLA